MDSHMWNLFWEQSSLWMAPMFMGTLCGIVCGHLGPWIYFQGMPFFTLTLTQVSSLGILLVHLISFLLGIQLASYWGLLGPIMLNIPICLILAHLESQKKVTMDHLTAGLFVVCLSLTVVIGDQLPHSAFEMTQILYGSAVAILKEDLIILTPVLLLFFGILLINHRKILHVIFDPLLERVHGTNVTFYYLLLFFCFAMILGAATKAIGALPIFAFTIFPTLAAMRMFKNIKLIFMSSAVMGGLSYIIGLFLSFYASFPSGAAVALVAFAFFIFSYLVSLIRIIKKKFKITSIQKQQGDFVCSK